MFLAVRFNPALLVMTSLIDYLMGTDYSIFVTAFYCPSYKGDVSLKRCSLHSLQGVQTKSMRSAPWFVRNSDLHKDLNLPTIHSHFKQLSKTYFERAAKHPNS